MGLSPFLIATNTVWGQIAGMTIQVFGAACAHINLNLYVMDNIAKKDFVKSEPLKLAFRHASRFTNNSSLGSSVGQVDIGRLAKPV